jgi:6-phosphogluconate dehydrogenase (decarboxylating)
MPQELGIVGLGRMGGGLAAQALEKGFRVVGLERGSPPRALTDAGLIAAQDASSFRIHLAPPRVVFLYVPAGATIDDVIAQLEPHLDPGDVIVDGGNSYWGDSVRRQARLKRGTVSAATLTVRASRSLASARKAVWEDSHRPGWITASAGCTFRGLE